MKSVVLYTIAILMVCASIGQSQAESPGSLDSSGHESQDVFTEDVGTEFGSDEIKVLPYRDLNRIMSLTTGITEESTRSHDGFDNAFGRPRLHLLGASHYTTAYRLDGVDIVNRLTGDMTFTISPQIVGLLSLPYGRDQVDICSRTGGEGFRVSLETVTDNAIGSGFDQNWYTVAIAGPLSNIPGARFSGLLERRWLGDHSPSLATDRLPDSPDRLPDNKLSGWSGHGRIDWDLAESASLVVAGAYSSDDWHEYLHEWYFNVHHTPRHSDENLVLSARLNKRLSERLEVMGAVSYFESERVTGDGVLFDDVRAYDRAYVWPDGEADGLSNPTLSNYMLFYTPYETQSVFSDPDTSVVSWTDTIIVGVDTTFTPRTDTVVSIDTVRVNVASLYDRVTKHQQRTISAEAEMTWLPSEKFLFRLSGRYTRHSFRMYSITRPSLGPGETNVFRYGYDEYGRESDDDNGSNGTRHPSELQFCVSNSTTWRTLRVTPALYLDMFKTNSQTLRSLASPFGDQGARDPVELIDVDDHVRVSPLVSLAWRPRASTRLTVSGGIRYAMPPYAAVFNDWSFFAARAGAGSNYSYPNGAVEPERYQTISCQLAHSFSKRLRAVVSGFHRKTTNQMALTRHLAVPSPFDMITNGRESTAQGLGVYILAAPHRYLNLSCNYSLSEVSTTSISSSVYSIGWRGTAGPLVEGVPLDYDRTHSLNLVADLRLDDDEGPALGNVHPFENSSLTVVYRGSSGKPFTPTELFDEVTERLVQVLPKGEVNSERQEWVTSVDLLFQRSFRIDDWSITPFLWVKNLLGRENVLDVYHGTEEADRTGWLDTEVGQTGVNFGTDPDGTGLNYGQQYVLKERDPRNYGAPRQVMFGIRANL